MSNRDTQRKKLYDAENEVRKAIGDRAMTDKVQAWAFIEKVERDRWFIQHYGRRKFNVGDGRGARIAMAWGRQSLRLPRWSRTPMVMLHEIAHCCTPSSDPGHGWQYAATYLKLVRHFMGVEIHDKLRESFRQRGVRYKRPKARVPLTPEKIEALRARMAEINAQRRAAKQQ